jgi:hypothetical protein
VSKHMQVFSYIPHISPIYEPIYDPNISQYKLHYINKRHGIIPGRYGKSPSHIVIGYISLPINYI